MAKKQDILLLTLLTLSLEILEMCNNPSFPHPTSTNAPNAIIFVTVPQYIPPTSISLTMSSIISNALFAEKCNFADVKSFDKIEELGLITSFLSEDELLKIASDKLTDEDVYNILIRITTSEPTKEDSKTLSLTGK